MNNNNDASSSDIVNWIDVDMEECEINGKIYSRVNENVKWQDFNRKICSIDNVLYIRSWRGTKKSTRRPVDKKERKRYMQAYRRKKRLELFELKLFFDENKK